MRRWSGLMTPPGNTSASYSFGLASSTTLSTFTLSPQSLTLQPLISPLFSPPTRCDCGRPRFVERLARPLVSSTCSKPSGARKAIFFPLVEKPSIPPVPWRQDASGRNAVAAVPGATAEGLWDSEVGARLLDRREPEGKAMARNPVIALRMVEGHRQGWNFGQSVTPGLRYDSGTRSVRLHGLGRLL